MQRELFNRWTAALRGGMYKQGKHTLKNDATKTYCCLGVLCDVMGLERVYSRETGDNVFVHEGYHYSGSLYPVPNGTYQEAPALYQILGLHKAAKMPWDDYKNSMDAILMNANDSQDKTFAEIADILDGFVAEGALELT